MEIELSNDVLVVTVAVRFTMMVLKVTVIQVFHGKLNHDPKYCDKDND